MQEKQEKETGKDSLALRLMLWGVGIVVALLAEVFVFNGNYWNDAMLTPVEVPLEFVSFAGETVREADGSVLLQDANDNNLLQIDLRSLTAPLRNIQIYAECTDGKEEWRKRTGEVYASPESAAVQARTVITMGSENRFLPDRLLAADTAQILRIPRKTHPEVITMLLQGEKGHTVRLYGIRLNARAPFRFSLLRFALLMALLSFLYTFRPWGPLWKRPLFDPKLRSGWLPVRELAVILLLLAAAIPCMIHQNTVYIQSEGGFAFYRDLAHALAAGHTYMDTVPSEELLAMEDPYDPVARLEQGVPFLLDYAFYQGKYYVYFGIVPCLLFYLPFYLIFGVDVPGWCVLSMLLWLVCLGMALLLYRMCRRYRPGIPQAGFLLLWVAMVSVLSLPQVMGDANNYAIPILAGNVFFLFAMTGYDIAREQQEQGKNGCKMLVAASLGMALVAGCRPQMILGAVMALPALKSLLITGEEDKKRIEWKRCICVVLPYLITAVGLMVYNAVRFGNPFEFGTRYNLTFAYVNQSGFNAETPVAGLYYYLFRPVQLSTICPYFVRSNMDWSNPGMLANHPSVGGMFWLYPVLLTGILLFFYKKRKQEKELFFYGLLAMGLTAVLVMTDAVMGGMMDRYKMDFAVFAALWMACGWLASQEDAMEGKKVYAMRVAGLLLTLGAVAVSSLSYLMEGVSCLRQVNPEAYAAIVRLIEFWR